MAARVASVFLAAFLTLAACLLANQLFPRSRLCALAVPLIIVFHPQLVLVFSYSNNDVTSSTLAAFMLLLSAHVLRSGLTVKSAAALGVMSGWLLLTKYSGYAVLPAVATALLCSLWIHRTSINKFLTCLALCAVLSLSLSLWWFVRNYQLFDGDILGIQTMRRQWAVIYSKPLTYFKSPIEIIFELRWWRFLWFSYWGYFGYLTRPLWRPLYFVYLGFLLSSIGGLIRALLAWRKARGGSLTSAIAAAIACNPADAPGQSVGSTNVPVNAEASGTTGDGSTSLQGCDTALAAAVIDASADSIPGQRLALIQPALWLTMAVCIVANLIAMIWSTTGNVGGPQGRYLFTSEIPVIASMVAGLSLLKEPWSKRLITGFVAFNIITYIWACAMLLPLYGWHWQAL